MSSSRKCTGRLFQRRGPAAAKLLSSNCVLYKSTTEEPEEGPPHHPVGGPHACSGASCCVGEPFWAHQNAKNLLVAGALPCTRWGSLQRSPRPPSWWGGAPRGFVAPVPKNPTHNVVIVLVLCVWKCTVLPYSIHVWDVVRWDGNGVLCKW